MGAISEKLVYLNGTKQAIKQAINEDFEVIDDNTTFREYADEISSNNAKYKDLIPKETTNATNTLDISNSSGLDKALFTQYGNTYQETTTGKNILNESTITAFLGGSVGEGASVEYVNGVLIVTPNAKGSVNINIRYSSLSLPANTYYMSCDIKSSDGNGSVTKINDGYVAWTDLNKPTVKTTYQRYSSTHEYTENKQLNSMLVQYVTNNSNEKIYVTNFMLSTSSDTNYEKYTGGNPAPNPDYPQTISNVTGTNTIKVIGKNLCDYDNNTDYSTYYLNNEGNWIDGGSNYINQKINITSNIISIYIGAKTGGAYIRLGQFKSDGTFITRTLINGSTNNITLNNDCSYIWLSTNKDSSTYFENVSVIYGNSISAYEPYKEQSYTINLGDIELCKIGDYKDRIYYSSGKWYLEKKIGKVVLNGSENWQSYINEINHLLTFRFNFADIKSANQIYLLSNYFKNVTNSDTANGEFRNRYNNYYNLEFVYTDITSVTDFKTWLSTHNTIVYYILNTPTTEEITESNYPTLYNQLNNIKLYEGVNHITMTNESGLDVEFDIEYYKDWKLD